MKQIFIYFSLYFFGVFSRLYYIYSDSSFEKYKGTGIYPFIEYDSFFFLTEAKQILFNFFQYPFNSVYDHNLYSLLLSFISKVFNLDLLFVSYYSPAFLAPLFLIPFYLIGKKLNKEKEMLFSSAFFLMSSIFFYRSVPGFSDTDSLIPFFIFMVFYALISFELTFKKISLLFFSSLFFHWWYIQSELLLFFIFISFSVYLFLEKKKEFIIPILIFGLLAISSFVLIIKIFLFISFFFLYKTKLERYILVFIFIAFLFSFSEFFISKLNYYFFKENVSSYSLNKMSVNISESKEMTIVDFKKVFLDNYILLVISLISFLYFSYKNKILLTLFPIFLLGIASFFGGVRFIIYLEPFLSIGLGFLIGTLFIKNNDILQKIFLLLLFISMLMFLTKEKPLLYSFPNFEKLNTYNNIPKLERNGLIFSSWHEGYPLMYYSNNLSFTNGSFHGNLLNFVSASIFLEDEKTAYSLLNRQAYNISNNFEKIEQNKLFGKIDERNNLYKPKNKEDLLKYIKTSDYEKFNKPLYVFVKKEWTPKTFIKEYSFKDENISYLFLNEKLIKQNESTSINLKEGKWFKYNKEIKISEYYENGKNIYKDKNGEFSLYINKDKLLLSDNRFKDSLLLRLLTNTYNKDLFNKIYEDNESILYQMR